ncbi:MAG: peptidoglycan DD-metalloendopeptidase family protein [Leptolyngbyaceae cyanobacterium RU_5_1]|nr:peptidoglycan DD-metalloendopeptidase family protein [Leptolyngbyaceae cyanobacterium RU_5_1]
MRRTFPQKVKPVPSDTDEHGVMAAQSKQAFSDSNRRVRTSAAMVGLAISMGAYSLPLPAHGDGAIAAEPIPGEPVTPSASSSFETAALSSSIDTSQSPLVSSQTQVPVIKHAVQEGQTLWDIAQFYKAPVTVIASANDLSLDSVLHVGQVLVIPVDSRLAQAVDSAPNASPVSPSYYGPVSGRAFTPSAVASLPDASSNEESDLQLKAKQGEAITKLKQKRESLRLGLAALGSNKPQVSSSDSQQVSNSEEIRPAQFLTPEAIGSAKRVEQQPSALKVIAQSEQQVAYNSSGQTQAPQPSAVSRPEVDNPGSVTYQVNRGDTLGKIAHSYGISVQQLAAANRLSNPNYVFVDQVLVIPQLQESVNDQHAFRVAIATVPPASSAADTSSSPLLSKPIVSSTAPAEAKIAVSSFMGGNSTEVAESSPKLLRRNHIENLKQEIGRLREKYQSQTTPSTVRSNTVTDVAIVPLVPDAHSESVSVPVERVNPEFKPDRYSNLRSQVRERLNPSQPGQFSTPTASLTPPKPQTQVVATAPLGPERYDPLVRSKIGQAVSPDLPPLGSSDAYLPGSSGKLDGYIWPTKGVVTSGYGWRWGRMHKGLDIAGPIGTPVVAAADGVVIHSGWNSGGYGYLVEVQHADGSVTLYAHNNRILVQVGQQVAQGQQISEMGSTGYSTGPHLHFEVHPTGKGAANPLAYLPRA